MFVIRVLTHIAHKGPDNWHHKSGHLQTRVIFPIYAESSSVRIILITDACDILTVVAELQKDWSLPGTHGCRRRFRLIRSMNCLLILVIRIIIPITEQ